jgi:hypothetical protein
MSDLTKSQTSILNKIKTRTQSDGRLYIDDLSLNLANLIKSHESDLNDYTVCIITDSLTHSHGASLRNSGNGKILFLFADGRAADSYFTSCADRITFPRATFEKAEKVFFID